FRYLGLSETLGVDQSTDLLPGGVAGFNGTLLLAPGTIRVGDRIETRNDFYGGQVGFQGEHSWGHVFLFSSLKVAVGATHETVHSFGFSTLTVPGAAPTSATGGLLAVPGTAQLTSHDAVAFVPEVNLNVGYEFGRHLRVYVGYTFLYWSDVARP